MPMNWMPPEEAFAVTIPKQTIGDFYLEEVTVYHVYKNQDFGNRLTFWYTFDQTEDAGMEFDIREVANEAPSLAIPVNDRTVGHNKHDHKEILQRALDNAVVTVSLGDPPTLNFPSHKNTEEG